MHPHSSDLLDNSRKNTYRRIMFVTGLELKNWRNFRKAEVSLREHTYLLGPNASGKSNFLDVFRFLRDISKPHGGGLQKAILDRGGIPKLRCLHARQDTEVLIQVEFSEDIESTESEWRYILGFKPEGKGAQRSLISREEVWQGKKSILKRPSDQDKRDSVLLTQSHLEQIQANSNFRIIADFFNEITYLHLVPQLLKYGDLIGGGRLEGDPFGQGFLEQIARSSERTRKSRLSKIESALSLAVPQFKGLKFLHDPIDGRPHLEARYEHYRPNAGWQREDQFSDGTLRMVGLFWSLLENNSLLLLEEPELSLNNAIVEQVPLMIEHLERTKKKQLRRQVITSTHSESLLSAQGIDARAVLIFDPTNEGTVIRSLTDNEKYAIEAGFSVAEVALRETRPPLVGQLSLWH